MIKRLFLFGLISLLFSFNAKASHLLGGEITWECLKSGPNQGKYIFKMYIYRDCSGASSPTFANLSVHNHPTISSIPMNHIGLVDRSPGCLDCGSNIQPGAIEESYFESNPVTLAGVPPNNTGWVFTWNSCCRPSNENGGSNDSYTLRAVMHNYNGQNANPCFDSSPKFAETPSSVICDGYDFTYNHNAVDPEIDSLSYSWDDPVTTATSWATNPYSYSTITWNAPYSVNNPMPGGVTLDNQTGEINLFPKITASEEGNYVSCVRVTAYKCGQPVAEIYRDVPVIIKTCQPTSCPNDTADNLPPTIFFQAGSQPPDTVLSYTDTVCAGDTVNFSMTAQDYQKNYDSGTCTSTYQDITLAPSGSQLGDNGFKSDSTGCISPPCATLSKPFVNGEQTASFYVETDFQWVTSCDHLSDNIGCVTLTNSYTFVFKTFDDYCPAPGLNYPTATITVIQPPKLDPPELYCANVNPNGDVDLTWQPPPLEVNPITSKYCNQYSPSSTFYSYEVFHATNRSGPYTRVDTFATYSANSYTHTGANAQSVQGFYFIKARSACNGKRESFSDTLQTIKMDVTPVQSDEVAYLTWNGLLFPFTATSMGEYYVWQKLPGQPWTVIDTTTNHFDSVAVGACFTDSMRFKVQIFDSSGCYSFSSTDGDFFDPVITPDVGEIDSVSVDAATGDVTISWAQSPTNGVDRYVIYQWVGGVLTPLDTLNGFTNTSYTHTGAGANGASQSYVVSPVDSCDVAGDTSKVHNTIFLQMDSIDYCENKTHLYWNKYINWPGSGVSHYEIYGDVNGGGYNLLGNVPGSDSTFADTNIANGNSYCYFIRAVNSDSTLTSTSNEFCVNVSGLLPNTIVDPPEMRCVSVLPNGDVEINWLEPANPDSNLASYHIYHSNDGTNFTEIDSIFNYNTTSYTHTGANGHVDDNYYYIESYSGCYGKDPSVASDTLRSMLLKVNMAQPYEAVLNWNPIHTPKLPSTNNTYTVYREYPLGSAPVSIGTTTFGNETFRDTMRLCDDTAYYHVTVDDASGCTSVSSIDTGKFKDDDPPPMQRLDSVSVDPVTGLATLGWRPNSAPDTWGYLIIYNNSGTFQVIDTVFGTTAYVDPATLSGADPQANSENYAVAAFDSCTAPGGGYQYIKNNFDFHNTIYLEQEFNTCARKVYLEWNHYDDWVTNPQYEVYSSENGAPYQLEGVTNGTTYAHSNINDGSDYTYYVRAEGSTTGLSSVTSTSNITDTAEVVLQDIPNFAYMYYATVADSNEVKLQAYVDTTADIDYYVLKKAVTATNVFSEVDSVPFSYDEMIDFVDNEVNTNENSYYYKLYVIDGCGEVSMISNIARTILLEAEANIPEATNKLSWNHYEEWSGDVDEYNIYRGVDGVIDPNPIATVPGTQNTYTDDISETMIGSGEFCYYVAANEGLATFNALDPAQSLSNIDCVNHDPYVYIPNAIVLYGDNPENKVFKPSIRFVDPNNYNMMIFNRWGEMLFQTNNVDQGWNGTYQGEKVQTGTYVYVIEYQSTSGENFTRRGSITVLK